MNLLNIIHRIFCRIEKNFGYLSSVITYVFVRILDKIRINGSPLSFRINHFVIDFRIFEILPAGIQILIEQHHISQHQCITNCRSSFQHILFIIGRFGYRTKNFLIAGTERLVFPFIHNHPVLPVIGTFQCPGRRIVNRRLAGRIDFITLDGNSILFIKNHFIYPFRSHETGCRIPI